MLFDLGFPMPKGLSDVIDFEVVPSRKRHLTVRWLMYSGTKRAKESGEEGRRDLLDQLTRFCVCRRFFSTLHSFISS